MIDVFIAEDEDLIRNGLKIVINKESDMRVVGTATNGLEVLQKITEASPSLILMDIQMPIMDGIECIKRIREVNNKVVIIILTTFNDEKYIIEGIAHGANGYLIKRPDFQKLIPTIRDAMSGDYILPAEVASKLVHYVFNNERHSRKKTIPASFTQGLDFTNREQEILNLLLQRLTNREISESLFISEGTIKNYLTTIYEKLGVKNRHEAIQLLESTVS
jgi:DNA-binding NarL/FixJ family response regulator